LDMFSQTEQLKWCHNYKMYTQKERFWISLCSTTQLGIFSYSLIISRNSQFTMYDISTQSTTIDERQRVKQFQMITDSIIASEYIPQHLTYCQKHLAANLFEFTTQPQSFASNCTLMSPVWIYPFKSIGWFLSFGSSQHFSPASLPLSFWPLRCRSMGLYMVQHICHGPEVANLTCSLGLALL